MIIPDIKHLKLLLVEDSLVDTKRIIRLLHKLGITNIQTAKSYREAVRQFDDNAFDILLVDIVLGKKVRRGDDFVRSIRKKNFTTPVVYITSFHETKIYEEVKSTSPKFFLSKDLSVLSLKQALELSFMHREGQNIVAPQKIGSDSFFVRIGNAYKSLSIVDIAYFQAKHKGTFIHIDDRSYITNSSLKDLEEHLYRHRFIRVHRSYLVNLNYIESINLKDAELTISGVSIPIGQVYRKGLIDSMDIL